MPGPLATVGDVARRHVQRWRAGRAARRAFAAAPEAERVQFTCNLCGGANAGTRAGLSREAASCAHCGSNVRFRAIACLVTHEVLGRAAVLPTLPAHRAIAGVGLSDTHLYADPLARIFDYENTYYHADPRLDIGDIPASRVGRYDFLISSDVFEHVTPPVGRAFVNARRMLKPGGKFIFTVPFTPDGVTREHFPALHEWSVADEGGTYVLTNRTADGRVETFRDLVFHGGPGTTLEMRVFSRAGLEEEFRRAGFARMRIADEPYLAYGVHWPEPWSVPMVAYAP